MGAESAVCQEKESSWTVIKVVELRRGAASSRDRYNREDLGELVFSPRSLRWFQLTLMAIWRGFASSALGTCISSMPSR